MKNKICENCWYYASVPTTNKFLDDSISLEDFPYCEFFEDFPVVKPNDTCENWKSHKDNLLRIVREVEEEMEMEYEEKLVRTVKNPDGYLGVPVDDTRILSYLNGIADGSYHKGTTEGYLTAAIIYHQLTEKILLMLINYSDLYIKAKIYPEKIDTFYQDFDSFGKLLKIHKTTVIFSKKRNIIKNANDLNKNRNKLVHEMYELGHEGNIDEVSKKIRENFKSIFKDWKKSMKWFYRQLDSLRSQTKWQELFKKYS